MLTVVCVALRGVLREHRVKSKLALDTFRAEKLTSSLTGKKPEATLKAASLFFMSRTRDCDPL
jgi:hypothetical protein